MAETFSGLRGCNCTVILREHQCGLMALFFDLNIFFLRRAVSRRSLKALIPVSRCFSDANAALEETTRTRRFLREAWGQSALLCVRTTKTDHPSHRREAEKSML